ncbi:hypothetical protein PR048_029871, partial [Dryococelus australis]
MDTSEAKKGNCICASFYLQAVLQTPCYEASVFFYKRKHSTFNLRVHETGTDQGCCYIWHEGVAILGSNEIRSCLLIFLNDSCKDKDVIFYSDICVGQNKNKYVASMYLYAVKKLEIKSIAHKFLEVGHTQNAWGMMRVLIEQQKQTQLKSGTIFVPSQWGVALNFVKNVDIENVVSNDIKLMRVSKDKPYTIQYKTIYDDEKTVSPFSKINITYTQLPPITDSKKKDLLSLCEANLITKHYYHFYKNFNS